MCVQMEDDCPASELHLAASAANKLANLGDFRLAGDDLPSDDLPHSEVITANMCDDRTCLLHGLRGEHMRWPGEVSADIQDPKF